MSVNYQTIQCAPSPRIKRYRRATKSRVPTAKVAPGAFSTPEVTPVVVSLPVDEPVAVAAVVVPGGAWTGWVIPTY